jgi:hypothetical protein
MNTLEGTCTNPTAADDGLTLERLLTTREVLLNLRKSLPVVGYFASLVVPALDAEGMPVFFRWALPPHEMQRAGIQAFVLVHPHNVARLEAAAQGRVQLVKLEEWPHVGSL